MTTVVLHAGLPKTGSSALQVAFAQQRETLARAGIVYPPAHRDELAQSGQTTAGNGIALLPYLDRFRPPDAATLETVCEQAQTAEGQTLFYSSETLWRVDLDRLSDMVAALRQVGVEEVRTVVCVRNLMEHAVSCYATIQDRTDHTFHEFVASEHGPPRYIRFRLRRRLARLADFTDVHVVHYDSERHRLLDAVCEAAFDRPLGLVAPGRVNSTDVYVTPTDADRDAMRRVMGADMEWVNRHYLGGLLTL